MQPKTLFVTFLSTFVDSTNVFDCCPTVRCDYVVVELVCVVDYVSDSVIVLLGSDGG